MKEFRNIWFPDTEIEMIEVMRNEDDVELAGAGVYQWRKLQAAIPHIKNFRHAIDVGANVGTWTRVLARLFTKVSAFEPVADLRDCFWKNIADADRKAVTRYGVALGDKNERVPFINDPYTSGWGHVATETELSTSEVDVRLMDDYLDVLPRTDFIKVDCEGFDAKVIIGARKLIKRDHPTILIERKGYTQGRYGEVDVVQLLINMGAELKFEWGGDFCLRWKQ